MATIKSAIVPMLQGLGVARVVAYFRLKWSELLFGIFVVFVVFAVFAESPREKYVYPSVYRLRTSSTAVSAVLTARCGDFRCFLLHMTHVGVQECGNLGR